MPIPAKGEKYNCAHCGGEFVADRDRQECIAEQEIIFDKEFEESETEVLCEECFQKMMVWWNREGKYLTEEQLKGRQ